MADALRVLLRDWGLPLALVATVLALPWLFGLIAAALW